MSLIINKKQTVFGNTEINQLYVRLTVTHGPDGNNVQVNTKTYDSKLSFVNGKFVNAFQVLGIPEYISFDYDRIDNGNDTLLFAHEKFKEYLSTDITYNKPVIDPSSGAIVLDVSTGLHVTELAIDQKKFTMDSSILIDLV